MTYEYRCVKCEHRFDVYKSVKDIDVNEFCPSCDSPAARQFVPSRVHFSGTKVQNAEYNPAFGCVVKNKQHRAELAKRHNVTEIGNDFKTPDTIHKHFDQAREEKKKKVWDEDV